MAWSNGDEGVVRRGTSTQTAGASGSHTSQKAEENVLFCRRKDNGRKCKCLLFRQEMNGRKKNKSFKGKLRSFLFKGIYDNE